MKSLAVGEKIKNSFQINCKYGKSEMFITNFGIMIENHIGVVLELDHAHLISMQHDDKLIRIMWKEYDDTFIFTFKSDDVSELMTSYTKAQSEYLNTSNQLK